MGERVIRIGLIGSGYMGKAYALGYRSAPVVRDGLGATVELEAVAASTEDSARRAARTLGFRRAVADWQGIVADPSIDIVVNNTPNRLHHEINMAAIAAGRHVHSEKPLGRTAAEAKETTLAAEAAGIRTIVGFNYRQNPAALLAREIVAGGELGEVVGVRATHDEDYLADPELPLMWKCWRETAGAGALADVGSHILCIIRFVVGPIAEVAGQLHTVIATRPVAPGASERGPVETDDQARLLCRFESGATGMIEASRVALGRRMLLSYEITGTRGSLYFNQERMSELQLYRHDGPPGRRGFTTLFLNEHHPGYAGFGMGPGHGVGFNDQKILECGEMLAAIVEGRPASPDFREGCEVNRVIDAVLRSHEERRWVAVGEIP
jgi:predicted dehydrogenase